MTQTDFQSCRILGGFLWLKIYIVVNRKAYMLSLLLNKRIRKIEEYALHDSTNAADPLRNLVPLYPKTASQRLGTKYSLEKQ